LDGTSIHDSTMTNEQPELEIGDKVHTPKTDEVHIVTFIHEGNCPQCGYDRIVVKGDIVPGVYYATCNNPECAFGHEV
jgi:hypothetical protein